MLIESVSLFPNPNTPDLGCFVERKHELEIDGGFQNIHVEFGESIDFNPNHHQVYFRVMCGEAAFFQRCFIYMTPDLSIPPPNLVVFPPDWVLGGDYTPRPSEWFRYPTHSGQRFYWFIGQHRNPSGGPWTADASVGHAYDIYENGTLSTVHYDDTGSDADLNDFILQVAVVGRRSWFDLVQAHDQEETNAKVEKLALPRIRQMQAQSLKKK